ncbi:hypothetical protein VTL71DRAFT_14828 [Oculimacula yallundae]|uniref:Uncharacterized protein n=1 Tax=Oculimacula yallundae TaxID=86028 RepID=A0ABR4CGX2_9HELO
MSPLAPLDPIVAALRPFSTCDVADALVKLNHTHGGFLFGPTMWSPERQAGDTKIIGQAYTVQYVFLDNTDAPTVDSHYVDSIPAGAVLFISSPRTVNAAYGGLMSTRAKASGAVGTVVDGIVRDLQEHRELGFPVFARDLGTTSPYGVMRVSGINVPVKLQNAEQDVAINPGDYIIGDVNGVICLPKRLAEKVINLIPSQVKADAMIARDIKEGLLFATASQNHRAGVRRV